MKFRFNIFLLVFELERTRNLPIHLFTHGYSYEQNN